MKFASNLHPAGLDMEHIMKLGGWESLDMILRYTRSVKFEESLRLHRGLKAQRDRIVLCKLSFT